jgi:hypothetical protein
MIFENPALTGMVHFNNGPYFAIGCVSEKSIGLQSE